jgi:hypothetical protein
MIRYVMTAILVGSLGCGGRQAPPPPDVRALLRTARYDEALAAAEDAARQNAGDVRTLALLATARAAAAAPDGSSEPAAEAALRVVAASSRGRAAESIAAEVTGSQAFQEARFIAAARVLAAVVEAWQPTPDEADARIAAAALLDAAAYGADHEAPMRAIEPLVTVAANLLEAVSGELVFPASQAHEAWICFRASGALADVGHRSGAQSLRQLASELAIRVAEANRQALAIPIACDIGSTRERLRETLRVNHAVEMMQRLSTVMEPAEGCVIGVYAP